MRCKNNIFVIFLAILDGVPHETPANRINTSGGLIKKYQLLDGNLKCLNIKVNICTKARNRLGKVVEIEFSSFR